MKNLQINRNELKNGMCDIEDMIEDLIKADLGVKKVSVTCLTRYWEGHTCPEFKAIADGVELLVFGDINHYDLDVDPWNYEMHIDYIFAN